MRNISFENYRKLGIRERESILITDGVCVASIQSNKQQYHLFQLDGFYIEVAIDNFNLEITECLAFEDLHYIEKYMNAISLKEIYAVLNNH
jgi:hypothetical protein